MTRYCRYSILLLLTLVLAGCGGGETPSEETATPRSTPSPAAGGGANDVMNTIVMSATNPDGEEDIEAICTGVVTKYKITGQRRKRVIWKIRNDDDYPCPGLQAAQVEVVFTDMVLAENASPTANPLDRMAGNNGSSDIKAFIHYDSMHAPNGVKDYLIYYQGERASRDPELDIQGDCAGCGL